MTIQAGTNTSAVKPGLPSFFMTRVPIVDRHQDVCAYELFFCHAELSQDGTQDEQLAVDILSHFIDLDMQRVVGELRGIVRVDETVLMGDVLTNLPRTRFVFSFAGLEITESLLQRLAELTEQGFMFALDEAQLPADTLEKLLPSIEIVRFDLHKRTLDELVQLTSQVCFSDKRLAVQNIETLAQFETCAALGFTSFQGAYFARPMLDPCRQLTPSQISIIEIVSMVTSDADSAQIEDVIKRDVALGLNLLRLVNSAALGLHRIDSLRQALMVLGRQQLASWLQIMLYAEDKGHSPSVKPLLMLATARGKFLELVALRHRPGNRSLADVAFTVGIMSLMDRLFCMPMTEIVKKIPVVDEVSQALLERKGYFGDLLALVEASERCEGAEVLIPMIEKFNLGSADLFALQADAYMWSNNIAQAMRH